MARDKIVSVAPAATDTTPLIPKDEPPPPLKPSFWKPIYSILLCGFLVSLSFGVTQVPLVYVFRLMTCDAYYESHSSPPSSTDRCALPAIEAGTARAVALLGGSTTFFGIANLFLTGRGIKRYGVKAALAMQVFWPGARLAVQNVGVSIGGSTGIIIVQCSQIITIIGGPAGYMLALNSYVADLTQDKERTGYLGVLQGCNMYGSAIGFLAGGLLAEAFSIITPFQVTLGLFLASTIYVLSCLPWIPPPEQEKEASKKAQSWVTLIFAPLKSIMPSLWMAEDGSILKSYGPPILATGVFLGVLASGYITTLLQLYATDVFGFGAKSNSYLVSSHLFLRGLFLTLIFPRILNTGRHMMETRLKHQPQHTNTHQPPATAPSPNETAQGMQSTSEPDALPQRLQDAHETYEFDLIYTRFSLLADGLLTLSAALVHTGWQMYLVGALLPLGAGTASSAKGSILQFCRPAERTDALSAISLVEMVARLSTTFVFGLVFAAFASVGRTEMVFVVNAGVALVGFAVLLASRFPPRGSRRVEKGEGGDGGQD